MTRKPLTIAALLLCGALSCEPPPYGGSCPASCPLPHSGCDAASDGRCICDLGYDSCGGACVSLPSDDLNCGACGTRCDTANGYTCNSSVCVCKIGPRHICGGDGGPEVCSDPASDPHNCGACGNDCGLLQCANSFCTCLPPLHECATVLVDGGSMRSCADVRDDLDNCGACGVVCGPPGESRDVRARAWQCASGSGGPSSCSCRAGYTHCPPVSGAPDSCVDLATDAQNCGSCANACVGGGCNASHCGCTAPGYVLCATAPPSDRFACHLPESTTTHCGNASGDNCGTDCTQLGVAGAICVGGVCACTINGDAGTICGLDAGSAPICVDLTSDPSNCGACFAPVSPPFETCGDGRPSCDVAAGELLCQLPDASFCTNINHGDPAHCGACAGPSSDCSVWNGDSSICVSSSCRCAEDVDSTPLAPDAGPAAHCVSSVAEGLCSCDASQHCPPATRLLSWGTDIFPLFQTGPGGITSASNLGCTASGCHSGGDQAAGHLDLSERDAGWTGLLSGPIAGGKICTTLPVPSTTGVYDCPCVAAALPDPLDPSQSSVLLAILSNGTFPPQCQTQLTHNDAQMKRLVFSPCAQLIIADWIDAGAYP